MPDILITLRLSVADDKLATHIKRGVNDNGYTSERGDLMLLSDAVADLVIAALVDGNEHPDVVLDASVNAKVIR